VHILNVFSSGSYFVSYKPGYFGRILYHSDLTLHTMFYECVLFKCFCLHCSSPLLQWKSKIANVSPSLPAYKWARGSMPRSITAKTRHCHWGHYQRLWQHWVVFHQSRNGTVFIQFVRNPGLHKVRLRVTIVVIGQVAILEFQEIQWAVTWWRFKNKRSDNFEWTITNDANYVFNATQEFKQTTTER
jgi:hypothetical protein